MRPVFGAEGIDARARLPGPSGIAHAHRDAPRRRRLHRLRMQHLGAEPRERLGVFVRQHGQHARAGDDARIGRQDAVDVGPDLDLVASRQAPTSAAE